jgi:hypothetical protein
MKVKTKSFGSTPVIEGASMVSETTQRKLESLELRLQRLEAQVTAGGGLPKAGGVRTVLGGVKCAVFDFDDCLVLSEAEKRAAFYDVAASFPGSKEILDGLFAAKGHTRHTICDHLAREVCERDLGMNRKPWFELSRDLVRRISDRMLERICAADEVPGALATLKHLHANGVVSLDPSPSNVPNVTPLFLSLSLSLSLCVCVSLDVL